MSNESNHPEKPDSSLLSQVAAAKNTILIGSVLALCAVPFGMAPLAIGLTGWYVIKEARFGTRDNDEPDQ